MLIDQNENMIEIETKIKMKWILNKEIIIN